MGAWEQDGVVGAVGQRFQDAHGGVGERHPMRAPRLHPLRWDDPNDGPVVDFAPPGVEHLADAGSRENQKPQRQRWDTVVTGQLRHEGGHCGIGHRGMVADRPHLGGLRQQLVQVAPPAGWVQLDSITDRA